MTRPSLLVTGTINRPDIMGILDSVRGGAALSFVEYERGFSGDTVDPARYAAYGPVATWESYRNAQALLDRTRPTAVIAFFVSSMHQVALRLAAHQRGIPTIHLEHGMRISADAVENELVFTAAAKRRRSGLDAVRTGLRTSRFLLSTMARLDRAHRAPLGRYVATVTRRGATLAVARDTGDLRRPDGYVSFSEQCLAFHRNLDSVPPHWPTRLVGFPQFDDFHRMPSQIDPSLVLLIDHQFANIGLFGWTPEYRKDWVAKLVALLERNDLRLVVKEHPEDRTGAWAAWSHHPRISVVDRAGMMEALPRVGVVLGCASTLQLPIAARRDTVLITLEIHPQTGYFPSREFVEGGAGVAAFDWPQLERLLVDRARLREQQRSAKEAFVSHFLYRVDGLAGERLRDALTNTDWATLRAPDWASR